MGVLKFPALFHGKELHASRSRASEAKLLQKAISENTIMLFVCLPKFCISIVSSFSWDLQWSEEKTKTMLMQNLGGQTKSIMVFSEMAYANQIYVNTDVLAFHLRQIASKTFNLTCIKFVQNKAIENTFSCYYKQPYFRGKVFKLATCEAIRMIRSIKQYLRSSDTQNVFLALFAVKHPQPAFFSQYFTANAARSTDGCCNACARRW